MTGKRIRVMLADDSPFLCRMLSVHLVQAEGFEVVGCVHRGRSVLHKIRELRPDAVSLGLNFPDMDGLDVLAQVMTEHPVPVVVLTGTGGRFAFRIARAMDLGAVDYVLKFVPGQPIQPEDLTRKIVSKLRLAAATKVVRLRAVSNTAMPRRPATRIAQDIVVIGASTGGFTEVLLERGASRVYAIDVGHGQLRANLCEDPRVVGLEGMDARSLDASVVPDPVGAIAADVSFISLTKALPAALHLAAPGAWLVALIKPQFEAGPDHVGRGGIVRDARIQLQVVNLVETWIAARSGWAVSGVVPSPILGGSGNAEFLIGATFSG